MSFAGICRALVPFSIAMLCWRVWDWKKHTCNGGVLIHYLEQKFHG